MIGFPKNDTEVFTLLEEGQKKGFLPTSGELFKCLEGQALYYKETGPPQRKMEGWRYFPFERVAKAGYQFFSLPEVFLGKPRPPVLSSAKVLPLRNGNPPSHFEMEGVKVWSWKDFLKGQLHLEGELRNKIFRALEEKRNSLSSLNNFSSHKGLILVVERDLKTPLEIQFLQDFNEGRKGLKFRIFLFVKDNCRANILETFYGSVFEREHEFDLEERNNADSSNGAFKNGGGSLPMEKSILLHLQTDGFVGKKSQLNYIRLDRGQERDVSFNQFFSDMDRGSKGCFLTVSLHSGLSRYETHLQQRKKSRSEVRGLSFVDKQRLAEHRVCVSHLEGEGFSNQLYQSLVFDSAKHVFNGLIHIAKKAQKTEAYQLNRNLLLGDRAFSVSCPELDVLADDVQAHHGASVSSLDESRELLFYLQSRGLSRERSLELVLFGAVRDLFSVMEDQVKDQLMSLVLNRLKERD